MERISYQSKKYARVQNLMHLINEESLKSAHRRQSRNKARGIDGIGKDEFGINLDENVHKIIASMKSMNYRPQPVRRTYIPKSNGKLRGLGIPAYGDKLVQDVMAKILNSIYEPRFLECSKGFRPNKRAQDAVREIVHNTTVCKVGYIVEADIRGFFDNVDHEWLLKFLRHDIDDEVFLRYIARFLKAGVMEGTEIYDSDKGTPQGGLVSPILANVYLHYVLDLWMEKYIKPRAKGEVYYVRYADDFIIMTQYKVEAEGILTALKERLAKFSLETADDKTKILGFGRWKGNKETFDFLGFTFGYGVTRNGKYRTNVYSSKKKLKDKRQAVRKWLHENMHMPTKILLEKLRTKLTGHNNYYGVSGNLHSVEKFFEYVRHVTYKTLCRRSQKKRLNWNKFSEIWIQYVPKPKISVNIWL